MEGVKRRRVAGRGALSQDERKMVNATEDP